MEANPPPSAYPQQPVAAGPPAYGYYPPQHAIQVGPVYHRPAPPSYIPHMVLACFMIICLLEYVFGVIAFALAGK